MEGIDEAFLEVIKEHTAGSPMDETIKWTNFEDKVFWKKTLSSKYRKYIANKLKDKGFPVSVTVVDKLLKKPKFCRRQAFKSEAGKKNIPDRDEQFQNIERLNQEYHDAGNPVMSMDVKKTELNSRLKFFEKKFQPRMEISFAKVKFIRKML